MAIVPARPLRSDEALGRDPDHRAGAVKTTRLDLGRHDHGQMRSILDVADNSGARKIAVINPIGGPPGVRAHR